MDNPPSTEEAMCSRKDLQIFLQVRQSFALTGLKAPSVYVCNLCRPEMARFSVINVHVLQNIGRFGGCTVGVCLFELDLFCAETPFVGNREPCQNVQCRRL